MKQKILVALAALSLMLMFSACNMAKENTSSLNQQNNSSSSIISSNIPENNSNGSYENNNDSSETLGDDISSFISSGNDALSSMLK